MVSLRTELLKGQAQLDVPGGEPHILPVLVDWSCGSPCISVDLLPAFYPLDHGNLSTHWNGVSPMFDWLGKCILGPYQKSMLGVLVVVAGGYSNRLLTQ